jgi:hypothetical protein
MGVLNDNVRHLPTLNDIPKAVLTTKKGNVPFGKADLAACTSGVCPDDWDPAHKMTLFQMVPKSFLSIPIHSTRCKYDSLAFCSKLLTGTCPFGGSNVILWDQV